MGLNTRELKASPMEQKNSKPRDIIVDPKGQWKQSKKVNTKKKNKKM
jgi:hypothetical protein